MAEYIDKKKIIDKLSEEFDMLVEEGHMPEGYLTALSLIEAIQAEDVVPVVRCKDCAKRGNDDCPMHIKGTPPNEEFLVKVDNDFCSHGVRRTDEKGT